QPVQVARERGGGKRRGSDDLLSSLFNVGSRTIPGGGGHSGGTSHGRSLGQRVVRGGPDRAAGTADAGLVCRTRTGEHSPLRGAARSWVPNTLTIAGTVPQDAPGARRGRYVNAGAVT